MSEIELITERFLKFVDKKDECWNWKGQIYPTGYRNFWMKRKNVLAHRASWMLHKGNIPKDLIVCHKCDNPCCVNPSHLFLGTYLENTRDMMRKKRIAKQETIIPKKRFPEVLKMVENGMSQRRIAKIFNVHQKTIFRLIHKMEKQNAIY